MKNIVIDSANFEKMISENKLYVDKTKFLYDIVSNNTYYFLSRPRRFGKSLFISTMEVFFSGKKDLFKDLYIYDKIDSWEEYPIIKLDFNSIPNENREVLEESINRRLYDIAKETQKTPFILIWCLFFIKSSSLRMSLF